MTTRNGERSEAFWMRHGVLTVFFGLGVYVALVLAGVRLLDPPAPATTTLTVALSQEIAVEELPSFPDNPPLTGPIRNPFSSTADTVAPPMSTVARLTFGAQIDLSVRQTTVTRAAADAAVSVVSRALVVSETGVQPLAIADSVALTDAPPDPPRARSPYTVRVGDCLWCIAEQILGPDASVAEIVAGWHSIYDANRTTIGPDPNVVHTGATILIPESLRPDPRPPP